MTDNKADPSELSIRIAKRMEAMDYSVKPSAYFDKKTGELRDGFYINGLGQVDAFVDLSNDGAAPRLSTFGTLQPGWAPPVLDADGKPVRERKSEGGKMVFTTKTHAPLDADALKHRNNKIAMQAKKSITGAVVLAIIQELPNIDPQLLADGLGLKKYDRKRGKDAKAEAGAAVDADDMGYDEQDNPFDSYSQPQPGGAPGM